MKIKRILFIILGCIGVGLGAVGAVLPLLPGAALPGLARVPLAGVQALSFGAYYKTLRDRPLLKEFLACPFAPPLPEKEALNHDDP